LASFPSVLNPGKELPPVKHHVHHFIEIEGIVVSGTHCRLDPEKLETARAEFAELERRESSEDPILIGLLRCTLRQNKMARGAPVVTSRD